jgi:acetyl esterase/lipase
MGATAARAEPASEFKAVPSPSGYVIVVHAGGWRIVGRGMLGFEYPNVGRLNGWGYSTLNVDYRAGADGLTDLLRFHDGLRRRIGKARLCVLGTSSGGHLALMLALRRPDVECAITEAAPTYLPGLTQPLLSAARRYFGPRGGLRTWSPALHPPRARLLLSHATNDPAVPFEQSARMLRAVPGAKRVALRPGKVGWVHTSVNAADLARLYRVERAFLDSGLAVSLALIPR